jgi:hypothetical protein
MSLTVLLLLFVGLASTSPAPSAEAAVAGVLDDWHAAAAAADETRYFGYFTPDYDLSVPIPNALMKEIKQRIEEHGRAKPGAPR